MLNEERVKHMVKLALYESKSTEEININTYEKKAYVREKSFVAFLWVTLGYVLLMTLLGITYMKDLSKLPQIWIAVIVISVLFLYLVISIWSVVFTRRLYQRKYITARRNVKRFVRDLEELERLYEREEA